eukprot:360851-Chlamydomonas_euryale.AAC.4
MMLVHACMHACMLGCSPPTWLLHHHPLRLPGQRVELLHQHRVSSRRPSGAGADRRRTSRRRGT